MGQEAWRTQPLALPHEQKGGLDRARCLLAPGALRSDNMEGLLLAAGGPGGWGAGGVSGAADLDGVRGQGGCGDLWRRCLDLL